MEVVIKSKEVQLLDDGVCILARYNELGQIIISKNERKKAKLEPILFIVFWGSIFFFSEQYNKYCYYIRTIGNDNKEKLSKKCM